MRKAYGPSGISYGYDLCRFIEDLESGSLVHVNGKNAFRKEAGRAGKEYYERLYDLADCVRYVGGVKTLVMKWEA